MTEIKIQEREQSLPLLGDQEGGVVLESVFVREHSIRVVKLQRAHGG